MSHWGHLPCQSPSWPMATSELHTPHPNMSLPCGYLSVHNPEGKNGMCESLQMASEHMQKVNRILWDWKKPHT